MRVSKKLRRTFPKTLKNPEGFAIEKSISSEKENDFSDMNQGYQPKSVTNNYQPQTSFTPAPTPAPAAESKPAPAPKPEPKPEQKKQPDTSMDMFRNMAKNIRR